MDTDIRFFIWNSIAFCKIVQNWYFPKSQAVEKGVSYGNFGISEILAEVPVSIRLFGSKFSNHTVVRFATELKIRGADCDDTSSTKTYPVSRCLKCLNVVVEYRKFGSPNSHFIWLKDPIFDLDLAHKP